MLDEGDLNLLIGCLRNLKINNSQEIKKYFL